MTSEPEDLLPMIDALGDFKADWAVCAFGAKEADCATLAVQHGGHCRIGFENNMLLPNGTIAPDNTALINSLTGRISAFEYNISKPIEARQILRME